MTLTIGIIPFALIIVASYIAGTAFHNFVNPQDKP